ncbi:protein-export membrane protein [Lasius niger]|uniref:Protein translocase subunit SecF n=1 Tax=Lasius niger TaxID=67767 RepID=A0A0J7N9P5_LASNI|nr:protein-export membrane protein [Lasius niger]
MKGRWAGLGTSACLSTLSIILFFHPGLKLGLDFRGGVVIEAHAPKAEPPEEIQKILQKKGIAASVQSFGSEQDYRISANSSGEENAQNSKNLVTQIQSALNEHMAGTKILRTDSVGASVSKELFRDGLLALFLSLGMIMIYIWIRFEREFAIAAVATLVLDLTKMVGFLILTGFEFDLIMVAALLTIIGYSTNDKVVVYDRVRENLRKYRTMPLIEILNLSINETLNRTLATSSTLFLAALPLALFGGSTLTAFAWVMLAGIVIGTSSSIFIASPLLLLMGNKRLRPHSK